MHDLTHNIDEFDEEYISKSELKRQMLAFQDFAMVLIKLTKHQRSKLPLAPELAEALLLADKIHNKHEALRRHVRYVGKLLSTMDLTELNQALDRLRNKHQQETIRFHQLEQTRDQLLMATNEEIEQFIVDHVNIERQKLRQLLRFAKKEQQAGQPGKYYRELFQYIKQHMS
jgi:ribosome-associated protein